MPVIIDRRAALGVLALFAAGCGALTASEEPAGEPAGEPAAPAQVVFPLPTERLVVAVEVAATDADRARGLGGHAPLGPTDGMLFVFDQVSPHAFWMKGMTFALDILWLDEGKVVHLERSVPPSGPTETDATRPILVPRLPARYVLEVNAGFAAEHGIDLGTPVELSGI